MVFRLKSQVTDKDMGYKRILQEIKVMQSKPFVKVGILKEHGKKGHKKGKGVTVLQVAVSNEYGTGKIPARSFVRSTYDENKRKWTEVTKRIKDQILLGKITALKGLKKIGVIIEEDIRKKIRTGDFAPNTAATIARKKSSKPLIDTGQLLQTIKSKVFKRSDTNR